LQHRGLGRFKDGGALTSEVIRGHRVAYRDGRCALLVREHVAPARPREICGIAQHTAVERRDFADARVLIVEVEGGSVHVEGIEYQLGNDVSKASWLAVQSLVSHLINMRTKMENPSTKREGTYELR
jgi:hypothetical protein